MPDDTDLSARAFEELIRVLEQAVRAGVSSVALEYKGRELLVFHQVGPLGMGADHIAAELQRAVIAELSKRAGLARKSRGKMRVGLLGKDYEAIVEEYDSFGEPSGKRGRCEFLPMEEQFTASPFSAPRLLSGNQNSTSDPISSP